MSQGRKKAIVCNAVELRRCVDKLLSPAVFAQVQFAADCSWTPLTLVATILFWVWSDEPTLVDRFSFARKVTMIAFKSQSTLSTAYQPFMRMLRRWSSQLLSIVTEYLRSSMMTSRFFREYGFAIFAVDGSRFELPRTQSNEQGFAAKRNNGKRKDRPRRKQTSSDRKKSTNPQCWMTTIWHIGCGLPWSWRLGENGSSERAHLLEMISELPRKALLTADAGFIGYDYWKAILDAKQDFVIRVGSNVNLLRKLGHARQSEDRVYLWPKSAARKDHKPLVLRLVVIEDGKHPVYLVTSVLSPSRLSDSQLAKIYARRWGVELFYRHAKQTFDRRKLRSHSAPNIPIELQWSIIGIWTVSWIAQLESPNARPEQISFARVLRAVRTILRQYKCLPDKGEEFSQLLSLARIDPYIRKSKTSRNYPRKKQDQHSIGKPTIRNATSTQTARAKILMAA